MSSASNNIQCRYYSYENTYAGTNYECAVENDLNFNSPETAKIDSITGTHAKWQFDEDVTSFRAMSKRIEYFPQNLDEFFGNLKVIFMHHNNLKEIHQSDLRPFKNLIHHSMAYNPIEVLEDGLFDYNLNLEVVGFEGTKIVHIGSNIFDHLYKLTTFWFGEVPCINQNVDHSRAVTLQLIQRAKQQCVNAEFTQLNREIESLEKNLVSLSPSIFNEEFGKFSLRFTNSKYSRFSPLKERFQKLNIWKSNVIGDN